MNKIYLILWVCLILENADIIAQTSFTLSEINWNDNKTSHFGFADVDGDGLDDLVLANYNDSGLVWAENLGSQQFGPDTNLILDFSLFAQDYPKLFRLSDLDADGDLDIVMVRESNLVSNLDHIISFIENLGGGQFSLEQQIDLTINKIQYLFVSDLDSNGYKDVIVNSPGGMLAYMNTQNQFATPILLLATAGLNTGCWLENLDNTKNLDFIFSKYHGPLLWNQNQASLTYGTQDVVDLDIRTTNLKSASIDTDNLRDLVYVDLHSDTLVWRTFKGLWQGVGPKNTILPGMSTYDNFEIGDLDNDGDVDIVAEAFNVDSIFVLWNDGNGNFAKQKISIPPQHDTYTGKINLRDVDNDGDLDIIFIRREILSGPSYAFNTQIFLLANGPGVSTSNFQTLDPLLELKLYPNPSKGLISFSETSKSFKQVKVLNRSGQIVFENQLTKSAIDLSALPKGEYTVILIDANGKRKSHKVILI
ncbi:MAG: T9SS type A sorting domain-containing protein [Flavobacteriales bacterium]|nr:T9SS type A sorting domain-containing protein [Flavobacteriales bacterium]